MYGFLHTLLFFDISVSTLHGTCNPILYDLNFACFPFTVSFAVNFERFTALETFIHSRKCQTLGVPQQSWGFTRDYYDPARQTPTSLTSTAGY